MTPTEDDLTRIVSTMRDLVCLHGTDGTILWVSPSVQPLLGYEPNEFVGLHPRLLVHPADAAALRALWNDSAGCDARAEVRLRARDGRYVWLDMLAMPLDDTRIHTTSREVTERRSHAASLQRHRELLEKLLRIPPWGMMAFASVRDPRGVVVDFEWLLANPAALAIAEISSEDVIGKRLLEVHPATRDDGLFERYVQVAQTGVPLEIELHYALENVNRWMHVAAVKLGGDWDGIAVTLQDTTVQKRVEAGLRENETRARAVLDTITDGIATIDTDGIIRSFNPACERIFGYSAKEVVGTNVKRLMPFPFREEHDRYIHRFLDTGEAHVIGIGREVQGLRRSGAVFPMNIELGEMRIGTQRMFVGILRDVTLHKQAAGEYRRLEQQLFQAQKMESLGTLAGGIAHDFNNLLMSILGNADLALQTREGSVEALLLDVKLAAQRASELTHQMLAYAGKGSFVYERTDINALVTELGGLLRSVISKRADLRFELAESLALVNCDPTQIRQVVMNLITNASDALEDRDGVITVATGIVDADMAQLESTILGKELTAGRYVTIVVTDTGVGMTKDVEVRIFDPFFTTKFTGRGLGMAAVVGILRSHKGTLRVQSEPGEGSSFSVLLPALSGPAPAFQAEFARAASEARGPRRGSASEALLKAAPVAAVLQPSAPLAPRSATPNPEKHGTILVADDEEPVLRVTQRILERAGYRVLLARDGEQALSIFREKMHEIDGVILDLTMPKLSGAEALREIRVLSPGARVLLASGYAEEDVLRRLVGVTTSHVLQKPCTPKVMLLKVAALLEDP